MSCGCIPCITVNTGTVQLVEKFGRFDRIANPGLNIVMPCLCEFPSATVSMRLQQMEVSCETKTKDNGDTPPPNPFQCRLLCHSHLGAR